MYTALPDPEGNELTGISASSVNFADEVEPRPDPLAKLYETVSRFALSHTAVDFAGCSPSGEKTQYTHTSKMIKCKGGNPPKDYSLAEDLIDLQDFVSKGLFTEALPYYFRLSRFA